MAAADGVPVEAVVMADVALVLLAGVVVAWVSRRLRQPPVVGEIAVGIMLGPSVLGLLGADLPEVIFPEAALPMLSSVAQIGLVVFMFLAGWEFDYARLRGGGRTVGTLAVLSMAVPFAVGAGTALLLRGYRPEDVSPGEFALFLGTALSITAFPVLARIIKDEGLSRKRVGTMAMACAAAGDVAAWCLLVMVVALADAGGSGSFVAILVWSGAYGAAMLLLVRPLLHRGVEYLVRKGDMGTALAVIVAGAFLSSFATSWVGIHAIFGAFAFGLIMPRQHAPAVLEQVRIPLERIAALFLPVFFIVTGLSVDIGTLGWAGFVALTLVMVAAVTGKFAGAAVPAKLSGMSWREAGAFGTLMNTRGLTEIVILGVGLEVGLIGGELFTILVLMALLTTVMAGPLLRLLRASDLRQSAAPTGSPARPVTPDCDESGSADAVERS